MRTAAVIIRRMASLRSAAVPRESEALRNNTSGSNNIALGVNAGMNLTTGSSNIDIGNRV